MATQYDINSIESLTFKEGVRRRVQMYLGSNDNEGTYQALKEIINNSTDEAIAGYGKKIIVEVDEALNKVSAIDFGRGVPFGVRDNGENVLVSIYTQSHTGGKFNHNAYKNSSGLNGLGGSCVCLSSLDFEVTSQRDGKKATATFHKGELVNYSEQKSGNKSTGTSVTFIPDPEVFDNEKIGYSYERVCSDIKDISYLYNGIEFIVRKKDNGELVCEESYCAKNGIVDFVKDNNENPLHKHIITASAANEEDSLEIAFQWGKQKEKSYVFVNGLRVPEAGTPVTGAKSAITKVVNSLANADFNGDKIRDGLFYVINCKVANPSFANQTKSKINNPSLRTLASQAFTSALKEMAAKYPEEFNTIITLLHKVQKADAAAEKARDAILNHEKKEAANRKKKISSSEKFKDCEQHGEDSILIICEGK